MIVNNGFKSLVFGILFGFQSPSQVERNLTDFLNGVLPRSTEAMRREISMQASYEAFILQRVSCLNHG